MGKPSVAQFISDQRSSGKTDSEITHNLLDAGWHMDIIHKAMHGDPIRHRNLEPILKPQNQPYKRRALAGIAALIVLILLALFI